MSDIFHNAVRDIQVQRAKIIEDYIRFWIAAQVPDAYLTPEWLADNLVLVQKQEGSGGYKFWVEFKGPSRNDSKGMT